VRGDGEVGIGEPRDEERPGLEVQALVIAGGEGMEFALEPLSLDVVQDLADAAISGCSISASRSSGTAGSPISANLPAIVRAIRSSASESRRISARI